MQSHRTSGSTDSNARLAARSVGDSGAEPDAKLAAAIETLIRNCGEDARRVLSDPERPQTRQAILRLSRRADTRQRYRIRGVREGRFRSIAPQNNDPVYDTVAFRKVPSRLWRARGAIQGLEQSLRSEAEPRVWDECRRLVEICRRSAIQLDWFLTAKSSKGARLSKRLSREAVWPILTGRDVRGHTVGQARLALRLTIKSVWDFPEMLKRGIIATDTERTRTRRELKTIIEVCTAIQSVKRPPSQRTRGRRSG